MKTTFACLLVAVCLALVSAQKAYTNKYDNVDVDKVLGNRRLLDNYINCLKGKGRCTPDGQTLKDVLADALQSDCSKCTEIQQKNSKKIIKFLRTNKPEDWNALLKIYDPKGIYRAKYEQQG